MRRTEWYASHISLPTILTGRGEPFAGDVPAVGVHDLVADYSEFEVLSGIQDARQGHVRQGRSKIARMKVVSCRELPVAAIATPCRKKALEERAVKFVKLFRPVFPRKHDARSRLEMQSATLSRARNIPSIGS